MRVAAIILNNRINQGTPFKSLGLSPIKFGPQKKLLTALELKISHFRYMDNKYGTRTPVVIMNASETQTEVQRYLEERKYFGIRDRLDTFAEEKTRGLDSHTGDFQEVTFPSGDLYALTGLFSLEIFPKLIEREIDFLFISEAVNLGATVDPAIIGMQKLNGSGLIAEVTSAEGFPRVAKLKGADSLLLEREEISDEVLANREFYTKFAPLRGTSTYWVSIDDLMTALGFQKDSAQGWRKVNVHEAAIRLPNAFLENGLILKNAEAGPGPGEVVYAWCPLSRLTLLIKPLFLEVHLNRYSTPADFENPRRLAELEEMNVFEL